MTERVTPAAAAALLMLMPVADDAVEASTLKAGFVVPLAPTARAFALVLVIVVAPTPSVLVLLFASNVPDVGSVTAVVLVTVMVVPKAPENVRAPASETAFPSIAATVAATDPLPLAVTSPVSAVIPPLAAAQDVTPLPSVFR